MSLIVQMKEAAKKSLRGKWMDAMIFTILLALILGVLSIMAGDDGQTEILTGQNRFYLVLGLLVSGAFAFGSHKYFLTIAKHKKPRYGMMFEGFNHYWRSLCLYMLMAAKMFGWAAVVGIPVGVILAGLPDDLSVVFWPTLAIPLFWCWVRYSQAWYVMADNPQLTAREAVNASKEMMAGHFWEYVWLLVSFAPWYLLGLATLGFAFIGVAPYLSTTTAHYYLQLKPSFFEKLKAEVLKEEGE